MFSVMLVDDEVWSIRGLEKLLPWSDMGFRIVATFTDAVEALQGVERLHPDVVFTDIRMPEVSGIDMIRHGRALSPAPEFVVISGYNDFHYAQAAVHYGAFDYCLKPIDADEGTRLLGRLSERLRIRRREVDAATYRDILAGRYRGMHTTSTEKLSGQTSDEGYWAVIAARTAHDELLEEAAEAVEGIEYQMLTPGVEEVIMIVHGSEQEVSLLAGTLDDILRRLGISGGMSMSSPDFKLVGNLTEEAEMAAAQDFVGPAVGLVHYRTERSEKLEVLTRELDAALSAYNYIRGCLLIDRIQELLRSEGLGVHHVVAVWNRFVASIEEWKIDVAPIGIMEHLNYSSIINHFESLERLTEHMKEVISCGIASLHLRKEASNNINSRFIRLLEYVNRNYKSKLKLSLLAEDYGLNFSYCCELFKRCTNGTFSAYVTGLRMKEALFLEKSGRYSLQQVAEMVGYTDYFYFSKRFKQFYGITPNQVKSVNRTQ